MYKAHFDKAAFDKGNNNFFCQKNQKFPKKDTHWLGLGLKIGPQ